MNLSPWKLAKTSLQCIQPRVLHRNWSVQILRHWVILILVIALSIVLIPLLQVLKARTFHTEKSYVMLPVFTREHELDSFRVPLKSRLSINVNTSRRLLMHPSDLARPIIPLPQWDPNVNSWKVKRYSLEKSILFVSMNVGSVSYYLDLDFRGQLIWINCKWKTKEKKSVWTTWIEKFKPHQLKGPHGLHVPANDTWCNRRLCGQLKTKENVPASCKYGPCYFNAQYGKNENLEGILIRANVSLCNTTVSISDKNYKFMKMVFGCVYKRRSRTSGKRMIYKDDLKSDGVLGLNGHPLSFPRQLYDKNKAENSILLCLTKTQSFSAGYIVFGFPLRDISTEVPWVPLFMSKGFYEVPLVNIKYGEEMVLAPKYIAFNGDSDEDSDEDSDKDSDEESEEDFFDLILDGSTRFTYLTNKLFLPFVNIVKKWAQKNGYDFQDIEGEEGTCWSFWKATVRDAELIHAFSNITFIFQGVGPTSFTQRMFVKPENYMISPAEGLVCLAIRSSDDIKQPKTNILGGMAMKEHLMLIDGMTKRFWWLEDKDCNEARLEKLVWEKKYKKKIK